MTKNSVFLDRDDTLIRCTDLPEPAWAGGLKGDTADPHWVIPLPRAINACRRLVAGGCTLIVITNQGLVARGHGRIADTTAVNDRVRELFVDEASRPLITACYACPFHPKGRVAHLTREHPWRKPSGGMIAAAAEELGLSLCNAWMIGDAERDEESGLAAGLQPHRCRRVGPGFGDLYDLVDEIIADVAMNGQGTGSSSVPLEQGSPEQPQLSQTTASVRPASHGVLRAHAGSPLDDPRVRDTVTAAAHGIAERTGVRVFSLNTTPDSVEVSIDGPRLVAMGFLAELRRTTNAWFAKDHDGRPLWVDSD